MSISSDDSHTFGDVSSSESEVNMSTADDRVSINDERDRVATITFRSRDGRALQEISRTILKVYKKARLNINLSGFRKAGTETRQGIVWEIMAHFNVPKEWREEVQHAAVKKAMNAWRNWKHVLYKKFLS
ncbi:hypothetical protein D1007_20274 [Hordeum vulgare]|nr:hypothetical protein D1007_20274 [Hordeum vulgare]